MKMRHAEWLFTRLFCHLCRRTRLPDHKNMTGTICSRTVRHGRKMGPNECGCSCVSLFFHICSSFVSLSIHEARGKYKYWQGLLQTLHFVTLTGLPLTVKKSTPGNWCALAGKDDTGNGERKIKHLHALCL